MGLTTSQPKYEAYGDTIDAALTSLQSLLKYHHGNVTVHVTEENEKKKYYVWDGKKHWIFFDRRCDQIRAYVIFN